MVKRRRKGMQMSRHSFFVGSTSTFMVEGKNEDKRQTKRVSDEPGGIYGVGKKIKCFEKCNPWIQETRTNEIFMTMA
jgi:hypothetical protein